jgi:hypothetical protein
VKQDHICDTFVSYCVQTPFCDAAVAKSTVMYTVKKVCDFPVPSQAGCHKPNSPWPGIIKLFPARESLVSDNPAGDGKIANLFTV